MSSKKSKPYVWVERAKVIAALRRTFRTYPPYKQVLDAAKYEYTVDSKHGKKMRRVGFRCNKCNQGFPRKQSVVDHIEPVVAIDTGYIDHNTFVKRLFCEINNLQVLCKVCHNEKSKAETKERVKTRKEKKV